MKKNLLLTVCILFISLISFAGKFVIIPVMESHNLEVLFADHDLKIHYYCDNYVLATANVVNYNHAAVLDENAFADVDAYAIVYCKNLLKDAYLSTISKSNTVLYSGDNFLIMKILSNDFKPAKNDGMVTVTNSEASLPRYTFDYPVITEPDEIVQNLVSQVSTESIMGYIQTLENFGTRRCDHANSVLAQNWIKDQYESFGLSPFIHTFTPPVHPWWGGTCQSGNVITIQYGTEFPDEYIVLGGHFDTFTYESASNAPGADDNASGSSGVMETARILSQYDFKRSIIYCAFTAEECGLDGSERYAQKCANEGMNILGYFNLDMIGYLYPGDPLKFYLIYPNNPALPLADYFVNIADIYFPTVPVSRHGNMPNGDSDHTSFNQKGYPGIWWFENVDCDSPYIHHTAGGTSWPPCGYYTPCTGITPCLGDIIGPSVNNQEQATVFTQAMVACIATLAELDGALPPPLTPPTNCVAEYMEDFNISITWNAPEGTTPDAYFVYQNSTLIAQTTELSYMDTLEDYATYCYTVTAIYYIEDEPKESEHSNESCASIPFPPLAPPTNCLAQYIEDEGIQITWEAPETNIPVDFYYLYKDQVNFTQTVACSYTDVVEDYDLHCYKVTAVFTIIDETIESEFSNESCDSIPFIDNITPYNSNFKIYPNPTTGELTIDNGQLTINSVEIFDIYGRKLHSSPLTSHLAPRTSINISHLQAGIYFVKISTEAGVTTRKIIKN